MSHTIKHATRYRIERTVHPVLVPLIHNQTPDEWLLRVALALAKNRRTYVRAIGIVPVETPEALSEATPDVQVARQHLQTLAETYASEPIQFDMHVRVSHEPWRIIQETVITHDISIVVLRWVPGRSDDVYGAHMDDLLGLIPCDVVAFSGPPPQHVKQILVPIRGSKESALLIETALALTEALNSRTTLLFAEGSQAQDRDTAIWQEIERSTRGHRLVTRRLRVTGNVVSAVRKIANEYDLIMVGVAEQHAGGGARRVGEIARSITNAVNTPIILVKTEYRPAHFDEVRTRYDELEIPPSPTSVIVDRWFAENTFSSDEFGDIAHLVDLKREQGLTISLGLPALNEEETIGNVITTIRDALMHEHPLLDEIVLIDSGSTDYTVEIARDLGIPVYLHSDILPQYGTYRGKGEGLWKSLYVLKGDIIAWIDTDIVNIHPRFVYGIVGPLLLRSDIHYVKGFYRRPLRVGEKMQAGGGGRVTELVARPLINLFYPELSGIIQPLSGEYAGRRRVLERLPFYTGYGVETGLLLSLVEQYGLSSIAQVDLRQRIHHNQPLPALSKMAFAIIQVFIEHLEERNQVRLLSDINRSMKLIQYEGGRYFLEELYISDIRRPPIATLPEYRKAFGLNEPAEEGEDA